MVYDFLIIGAGISGMSAGYELARHGSTLIVEAESSGSFHSTGRSAALYTPNYGNDLVCRVNRLSREFLVSPPADFCTHPLLSHRGMLTVAPRECEEALQALLVAGSSYMQALDSAQTQALAPFLRSERICGAAYEDDVADMDVHGLHQGFLTGYRNRGGSLIVDERVESLYKRGSDWSIETANQQFSARIVVNAAGAWADKIGNLAGAVSIGLVPKRRTALMIDAPDGLDVSHVPAIGFIGADNYIKPEAGQLMVSPGDTTPVDPQDIHADDLELAVLVDWLERETGIEVKRMNHSWAGLRSFVGDDSPVVGFDPQVDGFFWLAGQGGYGIMMSSALARATSELIKYHRLPLDFIDSGISEYELSVDRLL